MTMSSVAALSCSANHFADEDDCPDGRTELKYCVPAAIADIALDVARRYLVPDALALGRQQRVTSLYLDTPQLTFLRWHRERAADRFKLRIRGYGEQPVGTLYAELKRKTGSVGRKRRAAFPAPMLHAMLAGAHVGVSARSCTGSDLEAFTHRLRISGATPKVLVTCVREPLRDPHEAAAVTVDRALQCQPMRHADLIGDPDAWQPIALPSAGEPSAALIELKYGVGMLTWLDELILFLAPWRVSFSKYVAAMNAGPAGESC
jgi:hypothetical protein